MANIVGKHCVSAVALLLTAVSVASTSPLAPPVIKLAFYAPRAFYWPDQESPPVHIVGFEHGRSEIQLVLSNASDKAVSSVIIQEVTIAPPGCAAKPEYGSSSSSGGRYIVLIGPHGKAPLDLGAVHYPKMLVREARAWGTPYLQAQFGISRVYFQDGSTWPIPVDHHIDPGPFDMDPVKSAARNCPGVADVAAALDQVDINEIVFDRESSQAADFDAQHSAIPQLHFRCTLECSKAICRMPQETDSTAPQPQLEATEQK